MSVLSQSKVGSCCSWCQLIRSNRATTWSVLIAWRSYLEKGRQTLRQRTCEPGQHGISPLPRGGRLGLALARSIEARRSRRARRRIGKTQLSKNFDRMLLRARSSKSFFVSFVSLVFNAPGTGRPDAEPRRTRPGRPARDRHRSPDGGRLHGRFSGRT